MAKLTLLDLVSLQNEVSAIADLNTNFTSIENAVENTLSRDGTLPNSMQADIDMDSNDLLNCGGISMGGNKITNLGLGIDGSDSVNKTQLDAAVTSGIVPDGGITTVKLADNAVTIAKLAGATPGDVLYWDALGVASLLPIGTNGEFLTITTGLPAWGAGGGGGGEPSDGDKGDITVSGSGLVWNIDAGAVGTAEIATDAVTANEIATDAVGSDEIAANAVGTSEIATDAVTADKIAANAVGTSEILANAVTSSELATDSVTADAIAANNVGSSEITDNAVGLSQITGATAGDIIYWNGSGNPTFLPVGSDTQILTLASGIPSWGAAPAGSLTPHAANAGRLSLSASNPIPVTDVLAATTIFYTPFRGDLIGIYNGITWDLLAFSEVSISLAANAANTNYDVFGFDSSGLTLEAVAWTNDTTRATALVLQDGVLVKSGDTGRRYLGTYRTTIAGQSEDSAGGSNTIGKRFVWNANNRTRRPFLVFEPTVSWSYTTAAWRQMNANTNMKVEFVSGLDEAELDIFGVFSMTATATPAAGLGFDWTTGNPANALYSFGASGGAFGTVSVPLSRTVPIGYHTVVAVEFGNTAATFYGTLGSVSKTGINGAIIG